MDGAVSPQDRTLIAGNFGEVIPVDRVGTTIVQVPATFFPPSGPPNDGTGGAASGRVGGLVADTLQFRLLCL